MIFSTHRVLDPKPIFLSPFGGDVSREAIIREGLRKIRQKKKKDISRKVNSTHREMELKINVKHLGQHNCFRINEYRVYDKWATEDEDGQVGRRQIAESLCKGILILSYGQ